MSETFKLETVARETFGKGVARKLRAAGRTPVVVYGHGTEPIHRSVETHPLGLIVRHSNALIELDIDGAKQLVLVKDVQKDHVRQMIEHVDLVVVNQGERVEVEIHLSIVGEPFAGANALQEMNTLRLSVAAVSIPESLEINVEGLEDGTQILAGGVILPEGAELLDDPEQLVVNIVSPRTSAEDEAAEAAAAAV